MPNIKTAISLEQNLFEQVDELACTLNISRSRVFALAVEDYLRRRENRRLLEEINASCDDAPDPEKEQFLKLSRQSLHKVLDEW